MEKSKPESISNSQFEPATADPLFSLGQVVTTPGAYESIPIWDVLAALDRHQRGDWGDLCEHDQSENQLGLSQGFRIFSRYFSREGIRFWIITEADRSVTTVLLPSEY
jgi:hypothetical protein